MKEPTDRLLANFMKMIPTLQSTARCEFPMEKRALFSIVCVCVCVAERDDEIRRKKAQYLKH